MVLVTLATWTVRGLRTIPPISRGNLGSVKGSRKRFWLQIAAENPEKSLIGNGLGQKTVRNSGLDLVFRLERSLGMKIPRRAIDEEFRGGGPGEFGQFAAHLVRALRGLRQTHS